MVKKIDWDNQIGRRLRLRDLHVLFTVAQRGSMAKAAAQLGVSTPTVSEIIADLEHGLGVRLLDRNTKGVEPTKYGDALLKRTRIVFDELKQSIKDIEFLADPTTGEIRIASPQGIAFTVIPHVFEWFVKKYPRVVLHFDEVPAPFATRDFQELRDRKYDLVLERISPVQAEKPVADDLNIETLFDDQLVIAAGVQNRWVARRRKIDLAELVDEPWIMQGSQTWNYRNLMDACRARGLAMPRGSLVTLSMSVITHFLANDQFITAMPRSVAHFSLLKVLQVDLPVRPWPVTVVTLKNRTLSPAVERFIECARDFTRSLREERLVPKPYPTRNPRVSRRARPAQPAVR
jgi:DNA-binding transcriptional LysR family regulator